MLARTRHRSYQTPQTVFETIGRAGWAFLLPLQDQGEIPDRQYVGRRGNDAIQLATSHRRRHCRDVSPLAAQSEPIHLVVPGVARLRYTRRLCAVPWRGDAGVVGVGLSDATR